MTAVSSHYSSSDGDVLDQIALDHYGAATFDVLSVIMAANPDLSTLGPVLSAGVKIILPAYDPTPTKGTAQLWG